MSGKTATKQLREMLDERGVAHSDHYLSTTWRDGHGILHLAGEPMADGSLVVDMLTPEQAIAATLGSGTCECVAEYAKSPIDGKKIVLHRCSACHELMRPHMRYCPNCGRKVVG